MGTQILAEMKKQAAPTLASLRHSLSQRRMAPAHYPDEMSPSVRAEPGRGHDLNRVPIHPSISPAAQFCPLPSGPRACPFGGACHTCPTQVQAKLTIGRPGDPFEQEADRVAEQVVRGAQAVMAKGLDGGTCESAPSGETAGEEEQEETPVMSKACSEGRHEPSRSFEQRLSFTRGGGSPLPSETRSFMESRFGYSLKDVRIHTDSRDASLARDLNAEAFTSGSDIYFREGRYAPGTQAGTRLLAHELTHVIEQRAGSSIGRVVPAHGRDHVYPIQCFTLNGFPPTEAAAMTAAVPTAVSTVSSCSKLSWYGKSEIPKALNAVRYDYVPELGLCGWTFPSSWYIEIGKKAFDPSRCCDLPSTLAHEASHTVLYTESRARKMECDCFGCSC